MEHSNDVIFVALCPLLTAEHCVTCDDCLQAGDRPVQVVGAAGQGGELHPYNREETLH